MPLVNGLFDIAMQRAKDLYLKKRSIMKLERFKTKHRLLKISCVTSPT
jgi:hypothetical protein